jgi:mannose-6-phosphate isomerase-like protein (cupin superfamily)
MRMPFYNLNKMGYKQKKEKVFFKSITGDNSQLCFIKMEPGEKSWHHHAEEQIGFIISGEVEVKIGDETKVIGPREGYYIPGNVDHGFFVHTERPVEYFEVFCPPKNENRY